MNKAIIAIMAMVVLTIGIASAETSTSISFYQEDGVASFNTFHQVEGNYWNWPANPVPEVATAFVGTAASVEGGFQFNQEVIQYGNGQQWPNGDDNEWSMLERQGFYGDGDVEYQKHMEVWTVHEGWTTGYEGSGMFNEEEGMDTYSYDGVVNSGNTVFDYDKLSDGLFNSQSTVFINPFATP